MNALKQVIRDAENEGAPLIGPLKERAGRCFEFAFLALMAMRSDGIRDAHLVHGVVTGYHRDRIEAGHEVRMAHAWVEQGGDVYEATADLWVSLEAYYRSGEAAVERRYTAEEALFNCLAFPQFPFGLWHKTAGVFT